MVKELKSGSIYKRKKISPYQCKSESNSIITKLFFGHYLWAYYLFIFYFSKVYYLAKMCRLKQPYMYTNINRGIKVTHLH